ncbi:MAG: helix-turn-helix domain-containing protein [Ilumatobacteraceae bacterium]|nr:helix-turn-helix domain-containing protein [Ilumatobacteraceae bacterium]
MRRQQIPRNSTTIVTDPVPVLLTVEGLAQHLGVSIRTVRRLVAERRIPYLKCGHLIRFDPDEVNVWLEAQRVAPVACRR